MCRELMNSEKAPRWSDKQKIHKAEHLSWIIYILSPYLYYQHFQYFIF